MKKGYVIMCEYGGHHEMFNNIIYTSYTKAENKKQELMREYHTFLDIWEVSIEY